MVYSKYVGNWLKVRWQLTSSTTPTNFKYDAVIL